MPGEASEKGLNSSKVRTNKHPNVAEGPGTFARYQHLTAAHKIILWPRIYAVILAAGNHTAEDLEDIRDEGTPWFVRQDMAKHSKTLPCDVVVQPSEYDQSARTPDGQPRIRFPALSPKIMNELAARYFDTFNIIYPLLDADDFHDHVLPTVLRDGFGDGDATSVIALLVFALGKMARDGTFGEPIAEQPNFKTGLRGGSIDRPPGLDFFNEARKRIGFIMSQCDLESIQALLLAA